MGQGGSDSGAARYTENMSRDGVFLRRMKSGRNRDGKEPPRGDWTRPSSGDGASRGRRECDEAMATSRDSAKKRVRASESLGRRRGTKPLGGAAGPRRAGKANTRPSAEKCPSGRLAKVSRAKAQGAPTRRAWKKAHMPAGKGCGRESQRMESESTGGASAGYTVHRDGPTTPDSWE